MSVLEYIIQVVEGRDMAILIVGGDLDFEARSDFQKALGELRDTGTAKQVINLTKISQMTSLYIGTLIDFSQAASDAGVAVSVMLPKRVARVCEQVGLDRSVRIIQTDDGRG